LALEAKKALNTGKKLFDLFTQSPGTTFSLVAQQLAMDIVLNVEEGDTLDMSNLKLNLKEYAAKITSEDNYEAVKAELKAKCLVQLKGAPEKQPEKKEEAQPAQDAEKEKGKDKKGHKK